MAAHAAPAGAARPLAARSPRRACCGARAWLISSRVMLPLRSASSRSNMRGRRAARGAARRARCASSRREAAVIIGVEPGERPVGALDRPAARVTSASRSRPRRPGPAARPRRRRRRAGPRRDKMLIAFFIGTIPPVDSTVDGPPMPAGLSPNCVGGTEKLSRFVATASAKRRDERAMRRAVDITSRAATTSPNA